jgi:hypothetical protein
MKEEILKIAKDLEQGTITETEAQNLLLSLFGVSGRFYSDEEIRKMKYLSFCHGLVDDDTNEE